METMVLLKVAWTWTMPEETFFEPLALMTLGVSLPSPPPISSQTL
jgi:hypothetical protein